MVGASVCRSSGLRSGTILALCAVLTACSGGGDAAPSTEAASASSSSAEADLTGCFLAGATAAEAAQRASPRRSTTFSVGGTQGRVCYGAPSARGRVVMGELVPFDEPWRAGADEATGIHLDGPAVVGGVPLEAGAYALYVVPGRESWGVVLNGQPERWGIPIDEGVRAADVGSFSVVPEETEGSVETLTYAFAPTGPDAGELVLEWENTRIRIPVAAGTEM